MPRKREISPELFPDPPEQDEQTAQPAPQPGPAASSAVAGADPAAADFRGITNAVIDAPTEGAWFYHIVNPTPFPVRFTLRVRLEVQTATEEYLELLERINKALKQIRADGSYDKIQKKYFSFDIYGK